MYNRFNFKTAGVKLANTANSQPESKSNVNKVSDSVKPIPSLKYDDFTRQLWENPFSDNIQYNSTSGKLEYQAPKFQGTSTKENPMDLAEKEVQNLASGKPTEQNTKPTEQKAKPQDFDWKRLVNFNDPYFQYYTMPTALGLGIGGMFGGWKGAMLGGLGSLGVGALAKYLGENYDMTPKSSAPATQTTSPAAPVSTSNIA